MRTMGARCPRCGRAYRWRDTEPARRMKQICRRFFGSHGDLAAAVLYAATATWRCSCGIQLQLAEIPRDPLQAFYQGARLKWGAGNNLAMLAVVALGGAIASTRQWREAGMFVFFFGGALLIGRASLYYFIENRTNFDIVEAKEQDQKPSVATGAN